MTGSVTTSFTSSTRALNDTIVGRLYDRRQNEFMLNVANLTVERLPATDRWEAGFHVEAWFGQNAAVVKAAGLNLGSEADIWQAYTAFNIPLSGAGRYLQIKAGKMATLMGVEVGEDVLNPNLDVSSQDIFLEPFTETGVELDGKFSPRVDAEIRVTNGWDQVTDVNHAKSLMARLGLTPDDKTLIALSGYIGPEQADNTQQRDWAPNSFSPGRSALRPPLGSSSTMARKTVQLRAVGRLSGTRLAPGSPTTSHPRRRLRFAATT